MVRCVSRGRLRRRLPFLVVVLVLGAFGLLLYLQVLRIPVKVARNLHLFFNYAEAAVWTVAGACVFWRTRARRLQLRTLGIAAAAAFVLFGISDIVETRTGTWYEPWWLCAWKAACVICLLGCFVVYTRVTRKPGGQ